MEVFGGTPMGCLGYGGDEKEKKRWQTIVIDAVIIMQ
jgi:hypothetical protein